MTEFKEHIASMHLPANDSDQSRLLDCTHRRVDKHQGRLANFSRGFQRYQKLAASIRGEGFLIKGGAPW